MTPRRSGPPGRARQRGGATVLLMLGVLVAGCTLLAVGRAATIATDRARADLVAETVVAAAASDRVHGFDADAAVARATALGRLDGVAVLRIVEADGRIEVTVSRHGRRGHAVARLEW